MFSKRRKPIMALSSRHRRRLIASAALQEEIQVLGDEKFLSDTEGTVEGGDPSLDYLQSGDESTDSEVLVESLDLEDCDESTSDSGESVCDDMAEFRQALLEWGTKGVTRDKFSDLLKILRQHPCFSSLPADSRTLVNAQRASTSLLACMTGRDSKKCDSSGGKHIDLGVLPSQKNMEDQMGRVITMAVSNPSGPLKTLRMRQFNTTAPSTADRGHTLERLHPSQLPSSSEVTPIVATHVHSLRQPGSSEGDVSLRDIMTVIRRLKGRMTVEHTSLSEKIDVLAAKLDAVVQQNSPTFNDMELLHDLPATSHIGLLEVEQELEKNLEYRKVLINYLKRRCSSLLPNAVGQVQLSASITKCVNDCCVALMSNELASTYSMTGRSQGKISFSGTFSNLIDAVCVSVNEKAGGVLEISMQEVRSRMGEWMRQAVRRTEVGKAARIASYAAQVRARSSTASH